MKNAAIACATSLMISIPALADTNDIGPGQELAKLVFQSFEGADNGRADLGQFTDFGNDIFVSMDGDDDGNITLDEFKEWDFGFVFIAEDEGQQRAFDTAQKILFAFWDLDGDGQINGSEYHKSLIADFQRADINNDAFLSEEEFLRGYIVIRAYRAAVTGN